MSEAIGNQYRALNVQATDVQQNPVDIQKFVYFNSDCNDSIIYASNMYMQYVICVFFANFIVQILSVDF